MSSETVGAPAPCEPASRAPAVSDPTAGVGGLIEPTASAVDPSLPPGLAEAYVVALTAGMAPLDLSASPVYARAGLVSSALARWERATANGPCRACGCTSPRRGRAPSDDAAHFTPQGYCAWCASYPDDDALRAVALAAVCGLREATWVAPSAVLPLAHELPRPDGPQKAWQHLAPRVLDIREWSADHFPQSAFSPVWRLTPGYCTRVPGLPTLARVVVSRIPHPVGPANSEVVYAKPTAEDQARSNRRAARRELKRQARQDLARAKREPDTGKRVDLLTAIESRLTGKTS